MKGLISSPKTQKNTMQEKMLKLLKIDKIRFSCMIIPYQKHEKFYKDSGIVCI